MSTAIWWLALRGWRSRPASPTRSQAMHSPGFIAARGRRGASSALVPPVCSWRAYATAACAQPSGASRQVKQPQAGACALSEPPPPCLIGGYLRSAQSFIGGAWFGPASLRSGRAGSIGRPERSLQVYRLKRRGGDLKGVSKYILLPRAKQRCG